MKIIKLLHYVVKMFLRTQFIKIRKKIHYKYFNSEILSLSLIIYLNLFLSLHLIYILLNIKHKVAYRYS